MKYKYYDKPGRLLAESDSPIQFNLMRFPIWKKIKPVIEEEDEEVVTVESEAQTTKPEVEDSKPTSRRKYTRGAS